MGTQTLDPNRLIFSGTASHRGRKISVSPENSSLAHLHYGRIRLDAELPRLAFETGQRETALLAMHGGDWQVKVSGPGVPGGAGTYDLGLHDAVYVPRGCKLEVTT